MPMTASRQKSLIQFNSYIPTSSWFKYNSTCYIKKIKSLILSCLKVLNVSDGFMCHEMDGGEKRAIESFRNLKFGILLRRRESKLGHVLITKSCFVSRIPDLLLT